MTHVIKDRIFSPSIDEESCVIVSEMDMHDPILNLMSTNLGWKNDEFEVVNT